MSDTKPKPPIAPAAPESTAPADATGAGTIVAKPGSPDFDVDNASDEDYAQHAKILQRRAEVAGYTASPLTAVQSTTDAPAAPATFTAPSAPLIGKHDSATGLVQQLPEKLWGMLSEEDQARFTPAVAEKPADLAIV